MSPRWEDRQDERWIQLEGELDYLGCEALEPLFFEALEGGPETVVVDMKNVSFVGSHGIRLLLSANQSLGTKGRRLEVTGLRPHIRRIFETVGVFQVIPEHT